MSEWHASDRPTARKWRARQVTRMAKLRKDKEFLEKDRAALRKRMRRRRARGRPLTQAERKKVYRLAAIAHWKRRKRAGG